VEPEGYWRQQALKDLKIFYDSCFFFLINKVKQNYEKDKRNTRECIKRTQRKQIMRIFTDNRKKGTYAGVIIDNSVIAGLTHNLFFAEKRVALVRL